MLQVPLDRHVYYELTIYTVITKHFYDPFAEIKLLRWEHPMRGVSLPHLS